MDDFCLMIALKISKADSGLPKEITHAVKMPLPQFYREPISLVTPPDVHLAYTCCITVTTTVTTPQER